MKVIKSVELTRAMFIAHIELGRKIIVFGHTFSKGDDLNIKITSADSEQQLSLNWSYHKYLDLVIEHTRM